MPMTPEEKEKRRLARIERRARYEAEELERAERAYKTESEIKDKIVNLLENAVNIEIKCWRDDGIPIETFTVDSRVILEFKYDRTRVWCDSILAAEFGPTVTDELKVYTRTIGLKRLMKICQK